MRGPIRRWRQRGGRTVRILLPFEDLMEFALALLAISPEELEALGWTFADRKRLLDWFLTASKAAQGIEPAAVGRTPVELALPQRDVDRLLVFARRELPRSASRAGVVDRLLEALEAASYRTNATSASPG